MATIRKPDEATLKKMVTITATSGKKYTIYRDLLNRYYLYTVEKGGKETYTKHSAMNPLELEAKYCK